MLWEWPKLFDYWTKIFTNFENLKDAFDIDIDTNPLLAIFGLAAEVNLLVMA